MKKQYTIYTIGYTAFPDEKQFIDILKKLNITCVVDVRSNPIASEYYQVYSRNSLEPLLNQNRILYRNYSKEFGARQENKKYYMIYKNEGKTEQCLNFELFTKSNEFIDGVEKIKKGIDLGYTFVLMCAEKDPIDCHRTIMIARALSNMDFDVKHILYDGTIETQTSIDERLLCKYKYQPSFLQSKEEQIAEAYRKRNIEIGYKGSY